MKNISIKMKITLWYTLFMTMLIFIILSLLITISNSRIISSTKDELIKYVTQSVADIEFEEGYLEFDEDFTVLAKGVYLSVYDTDGTLLYGHIPPDFDSTIDFQEEHLRKFTTNQNIWYFYDHDSFIEGYGIVWIRGITSLTHNDSAIQILV